MCVHSMPWETKENKSDSVWWDHMPPPIKQPLRHSARFRSSLSISFIKISAATCPLPVPKSSLTSAVYHWHDVTEVRALDLLWDRLPFHSLSVAISHALHWPCAKHLHNRPLGQYYFVYIYSVYKEVSQNLIPGIQGPHFFCS